MKSFRKTIIVLLIVTVMIGLYSVVFAFDDDIGYETISDDRDNATGTGTPTPTSSNTNSLFDDVSTPTPTATPTPTTAATATPTKTPTATSMSNSVYNTTNSTNLPKAGSSDGIFTVAIIVIFGVIALYAYKKVRDYNI